MFFNFQQKIYSFYNALQFLLSVTFVKVSTSSFKSLGSTTSSGRRCNFSWLIRVNIRCFKVFPHFLFKKYLNTLLWFDFSLSKFCMLCICLFVNIVNQLKEEPKKLLLLISDIYSRILRIVTKYLVFLIF